MEKQQELLDPNSCWNRATAHELVFVSLGRDVAAPAGIRAWASERIRLGKNAEGDSQIQEALALADKMEKTSS